jgi:hypothetical protein
MINVLAQIIQQVPDSSIIPSDSFWGAFCLVGIIYTLILLIMGWCGFVGWLVAVCLSIFCFFNLCPVDDELFVTKTTLGWITKADVNGGLLSEAETNKVRERDQYYYRPHLEGKISWKLYHPIVWFICPIIALSLSPYTWIVVALIITFGNAGKNS